MIVPKNQQDSKEVQNLRDGKGSVHISSLVPDGISHLGMYVRVTIPPGSSIGEHTHHNDTEIYYILSGIGMCLDNGQSHEVTPGDVIVTGDGDSHALLNTGEDNLQLLAFVVK